MKESFMKVRYLGHSCVEIIGRHHILIDPDFTQDPGSDIEYILVSHVHMDHIARIAEITESIVVASADVCEIAIKLRISRDRVLPVIPGENVELLHQFSINNNLFGNDSKSHLQVTIKDVYK